MAKHVKISTIGCGFHQVDGSHSHAETWEQVKKHLTRQMEQVLPDRPDLIVLPEVCDVPEGYDAASLQAYIKHRGDANIRFFSDIAKAAHCNIAFTTYIPANGGHLHNTCVIIDRQGAVAGTYDKNYIPPMETYSNVRCGTEAPLIQLDIGRVACVICFDLNFDALLMHYKATKPDLIIFPSMFHGGIMQQLWAQSCRSYFVSSIAHSRPSAIISPVGEVLAYSTNYQNHVTKTVNLDYELIHVDFNMEKLSRLKQKYGTEVTIFDPGNIGYVMLCSESKDVSAADMLREFEITALDDYLEYALGMEANQRDDVMFYDEAKANDDGYRISSKDLRRKYKK
ncbi:MAG: hypothetical protein FWD03_04575 [Defluviitaleaceae bacterium]|nr:hypothetical protein [Defluviitaleaceae bacterium]